MNKYNPQEIEQKWQRYWEEKKIFQTKDEANRPKFYILDMFPYPSGEGLHVGHVKGYTATDAVARMKMAQGYNVLHPMGWDAFGLPTENFALKNKVHPAEATAKNIQTFKNQLGLLGFTYDWDREINTTDPQYYKWTQWIFLQLFKRGLAYESYEPINWCPSCQTGLANEDLEDGKCERCGSVIERKPMRQWVLKITDYAERLLRDLEKLPEWEESIKEMQKNWIGKSQGASVRFDVILNEAKRSEESLSNKKGSFANAQDDKRVLEIFTTRPDTLFGATYMVVAPEHPLVASLLKIPNPKSQIPNINEVKKYVEEVKNKSDLERTDLAKKKTGVEIKGLKAVNPVNGEELPIWVADYVLMNYGAGAIMAVPGHDERDWEFAKKYGLPVKEVVIKSFGEKRDNEIRRDSVKAIIIRDKKILVNKEQKGWYSLIGGGKKDEESDMEALSREIKEETGYVDFEIKEYLGSIESHGFSSVINDNRLRFMTGYAVNLLSERSDRGLIIEEESNPEWLEFSEAIKELSKSTIGGEQEFVERYLDKKRICFTGDGVSINSDFLSDLNTAQAKEKMIEWLEEKGVGKRQVQYKIRDWVFSRQRYWGEPIPLIKCEKCARLPGGQGWVPVSEKDLPLELPPVKHYEPTGTGESPLANISEWVNTKCPQCGGPAKRETNTMPQWAGSCWYYLRYIDSQNSKALVDKKKEKYWSPVDLYVGGAEHATRHLIYARFWHKFLYDIGAVSHDEPFLKLRHVGLVLAEDGRKMSKRWGNVINPNDVIINYGADAMRLYEMFMGPFDQPGAWSKQGLVGMRRFLERVWTIGESGIAASSSTPRNDKLTTLIHQTIKKVTEDIENMRFNTALSALMILTNTLAEEEKIAAEDFETLILLLSPFAPHLAEELWEGLGHKKSIIFEKWPAYDSALIQAGEMNIAVQINGKLRDSLVIPVGWDEEAVKNQVLASEKVKKWLAGQSPKKMIYVKGKLVSIVV